MTAIDFVVDLNRTTTLHGCTPRTIDLSRYNNCFTHRKFGLLFPSVLNITDFRRHIARAFALQGSFYDDTQHELGKRLENAAHIMFSLFSNPSECIQKMINMELKGSDGDLQCNADAIVNLPEPDELFVNVLIDVSNRVQLEKTNKTIVNIVNDNDEVMVLKEQLKSMTERMERAERINHLVLNVLKKNKKLQIIVIYI